MMPDDAFTACAEGYPGTWVCAYRTPQVSTVSGKIPLPTHESMSSPESGWLRACGCLDPVKAPWSGKRLDSPLMTRRRSRVVQQWMPSQAVREI